MSCKDAGQLLGNLCDGFDYSPWVWMGLRLGVLALCGVLYWALFLKR